MPQVTLLAATGKEFNKVSLEVLRKSKGGNNFNDCSLPFLCFVFLEM